MIEDLRELHRAVGDVLVGLERLAPVLTAWAASRHQPGFAAEPQERVEDAPATGTAANGAATAGEPMPSPGEASEPVAQSRRCAVCNSTFAVTRPSGQPKKFCSRKCREKATRQRRPAKASAAVVAEPDREPAPAVHEPPLEPLPAMTERPFRAPSFGKGGEDPEKSRLLASVSRLPWELNP
jgi:hypothetical protein